MDPPRHQSRTATDHPKLLSRTAMALPRLPCKTVMDLPKLPCSRDPSLFLCQSQFCLSLWCCLKDLLRLEAAVAMARQDHHHPRGPRTGLLLLRSGPLLHRPRGPPTGRLHLRSLSTAPGPSTSQDHLHQSPSTSPGPTLPLRGRSTSPQADLSTSPHPGLSTSLSPAGLSQPISLLQGLRGPHSLLQCCPVLLSSHLTASLLLPLNPAATPGHRLSPTCPRSPAST